MTDREALENILQRLNGPASNQLWDIRKIAEAALAATPALTRNTLAMTTDENLAAATHAVGGEALIGAVTDELLAHGEFSYAGNNRLNAEIAAKAVIDIVLAATPAFGGEALTIEAVRERMPKYVSTRAREFACEAMNDMVDEIHDGGVYALAQWFDALAAAPAISGENDDNPVEVFNGDRKVIVYKEEVECIWGMGMEGGMLCEQRDHETVAAAFNWLFLDGPLPHFDEK